MSDKTNGWIGIDLDGTLAEYSGWKGANHIGNPIPSMLEKVKKLLSDGIEVRIFTARACIPAQISPVKDWCMKHLGVELEVTNSKDFGMIELYDDRCVQMIANTGLRADGKEL